MKKQIKILLLYGLLLLLFPFSVFALTGSIDELQRLFGGEHTLGATVLFPGGGGTGTSTAPTAGQLLRGKSTGVYELLATSTDGAVLSLDTNGYPAWAATSSLGLTGLVNPMTAAGDLIYGGAAGAATRLASSSDYSILNTDANGYPAWTQTLGTEGNPLTAISATSLYASTTYISSFVNAPMIVSTSTLSAPDIYWRYDTNTGLGWIADDKQALYTGGTARLVVDSSGNVGIGTTTPQSSLSVVGASATKGTLSVFSSTGVSTDSTFSVFGDVSPDELERFRITRAGNVGIGTTTPDRTLTVFGAGSWANNIGIAHITDNGDYGAGLTFETQGAGGKMYSLISGTSISGVGGGNFGVFNGSAGTYPFVITNAGNVGIGTTSPSSALEVVGGIMTSDASREFRLLSSGGTLYLSDMTSNADRLVVNSTGNLGIGTTSPGSLLSLNNIANFTTATSSFYGNGINLEDGCFAVNGTCVGGGGGSGLTSLNGETGATQTFATSSTDSTNFTITSSGNVHTLNIPPASATANGLITTGIQTIGGSKSFGGSIGVNSSGLTTAGTFQNTATNLSVINSTNSDNTPGRLLRGSVRTSLKGLINPNNTTIVNADDAYSAFVLGNSGIITEQSSGNHPLLSQLAIKPFYVTAGVATVSDTASLYIEGAATTTVVSGQNYALWVDDVGGGGISRIDGKLMVGATSTSPFTLAVQGSALADDWLTYSPMSDKADALSEIKNIKCETGTSVNGWCNIDHASLPQGVRVQAPYKVKNIVGYKPPVEVENWDEEKKATTTSMWSEPIQEEKEVMGDYMSMTKLTAMLVQSTQELDVRVSALETSQLGGSLNSQGDYVSEAVKQEIDNRIDAKKDEIKDYVIEAIQEMSFKEKIKLLF